jgi:hypothetical protein
MEAIQFHQQSNLQNSRDNFQPSKGGEAIGRKGWRDDLCEGENGFCGGFDLRKTARGASSPAKPALHIPELNRNSLVSYSSRYFKRWLGVVEGGGSPLGWNATAVVAD